MHFMHQEDQAVTQNHAIVLGHMAHLVKISKLLFGYSVSCGQVGGHDTWGVVGLNKDPHVCAFTHAYLTLTIFSKCWPFTMAQS